VSLRRHITLIRQNTYPVPDRTTYARKNSFSLLRLRGIVKGVFSPNPPFCLFLRTCPARPIRAHTCSAITRRLGGWLGASVTQRRFESSEALAQPGSGAHSRGAAWMVAAPGCRLHRRSSANILTAWPGRVAQAPRAGRARAPWSCWLTMLAPIVENCTVRGSARARRPVDYEANSIANRGRLRHGPAQLAMA